MAARICFKLPTINHLQKFERADVFGQSGLSLPRFDPIPEPLLFSLTLSSSKKGKLFIFGERGGCGGHERMRVSVAVKPDRTVVWVRLCGKGGLARPMARRMWIHFCPIATVFF
jgi:hypothetical protein